MSPEQDGPWISEESYCEWCDHEWVAVHPCAERLECPRCCMITPSTHSKNHNTWIIKNIPGE